MDERPKWLKREKRDWNKIYSEHNLEEIPWYSDKPDQEFVELIETEKIKPCCVLDVGCGAGTDAIYLASTGYTVTAMDISQKAIKITKKKAEKVGAKINFIVGNFLEVEFDNESFDFINDRGCFHGINPMDRENFAMKINEMLKSNGYYYLRCWSDKEEECNRGPYRISKDDIKNTFSKYFKIGVIKDFRFGGKGARGYACLMRKEESL